MKLGENYLTHNPQPQVNLLKRAWRKALALTLEQRVTALEALAHTH